MYNMPSFARCCFLGQGHQLNDGRQNQNNMMQSRTVEAPPPRIGSAVLVYYWLCDIWLVTFFRRLTRDA